VVVPAGVVGRGPAEQPDVDIAVAVQGGEDAFVVVVGDLVLPQVRLGGDRGRELGQW